MKYYVWIHDLYDQTLVRITDLPFSESQYGEWNKLVDEGIPSKKSFPKNVIFEINLNYGIKIADSLPNTINCFIVSENLKNILDEASGDYEFFSIKLRDYKGKIIEYPYYVSNLINTLHCMDYITSDFDMPWRSCDRHIKEIRRLILDESKIPNNIQIFRLDTILNKLVLPNKYAAISLIGEPRRIVVTKTLAIKIKREAKCTGLYFVPLEEYTDFLKREFRRPLFPNIKKL
ncbi:MAG: DUF1629 domain-containing protein [bacterium]